MTTQTLDLSGPVPLIDGVPVHPIFGATGPGPGRMGIHSSGDLITTATLVSQLADGLSLDTLFEELTETFSLWNTERAGISDLLSFKVTVPGEAVPQSIAIGDPLTGPLAGLRRVVGVVVPAS